MTKTLKKQLAQIQYADLSRFDPDTNSYFIPKRLDIKLEKNRFYLLEISEDLKTDVIMKNNWNNGYSPKSTYYIVEITDIIANKILKCSGSGYLDDLITVNDIWSGYFPLNKIKILKEIK